MPCGHYYCAACVRRMSRLALGDRALVPLRCCKKEFPMEYVDESLPDAEEFDKYCRMLREKDWKKSDLVSDSDYARSVRKVGGKQCPGCGVGVERDNGCIHMTCPNGHQFCFTCVQMWGLCSCQLIPEEELRRILGED